MTKDYMDAVFTLKNLPLKKLYSGKVRELFEINESSMLMVTTDRISAFDFILSTPVPGKGKILNRLSLFWFDYLRDIFRTMSWCPILPDFRIL